MTSQAVAMAYSTARAQRDRQTEQALCDDGTTGSQGSLS
jgi:hypothetical protein